MGAVVKRRVAVGDGAFIKYLVKTRRGVVGGPVVKAVEVFINNYMRLEVPFDEQKESFRLEGGQESPAVAGYVVGQFDPAEAAEAYQEDQGNLAFIDYMEERMRQKQKWEEAS
jgi:hypothetical protein